jgi:Fe-S-cluster containining protein
MPRFDCQSCGACCCNTARNREAETLDYVEVTREDRLFVEDRPLLRRLGERNEDGVWHLKLVGEEQRCIALDGDLGEGVGCAIYRMRPAGCRAVESGDEECLKARRHLGLPLTLEGDRARGV